MKTYVGGKASPEGFELTVLQFHNGRKLNSFRAATTKHDPQKTLTHYAEGRLWTLLFLFIYFAGAGVFLVTTVRILNNGSIEHFVLGAIIFALFNGLWHKACGLLVAWIAFSRERTHAQWHGCEHKLAEVYTHNRPRTLKELRGASRVSSDCGSMPPFRMWLFTLSCLAGPTLWAFVPDFHDVNLVLLSIGCWLFSIEYGALLLQWLLATAKPTHAQYQEALLLAARIDDALSQQASQ